HDGDAVRAVEQRAEAGDVIGMDVGVDRLDQLEVELVDELQVAVNLLQDGINDEGLAAATAGHQVAVGARDAVEQLAEDHAGLHGKCTCKILAHASGMVRSSNTSTIIGTAGKALERSQSPRDNGLLYRRGSPAWTGFPVATRSAASVWMRRIC